MIFDQPRQTIEFQDRSDGRRAELNKLIAIFGETFSPVRYRVLENVATVNAQASVSNEGALVGIFGGLAFHPKVQHDGLVFTLLHETGHHLSGGCKLPWAPLACECAADIWATTAGRKALQIRGISFLLNAALMQIEDATKPKQSNRTSRTAVRKSCSAMDWRERKQNLLTGGLVNFRTCKISSALGR